MFTITYQQIHEETQRFENNHGILSQSEESVVTACKALLKNNLTRLGEKLSAEEQFNLFFIIFDSATMSAREASNQKTAMAILLLNMRNIVLKNVLDKKKSAVCELLRRLSSYLFFRDKENWQANFEAVTRGCAYADSINDALTRLSAADLLAGAHAQANFEAITQGDGRYAWSIARALIQLNTANLLTGTYAQANFEAVTRGCAYTGSINDALTRLSAANLLTGVYAQANFEAITQGGGQYASGIASALFELNAAYVLITQANFEAITQGGGQYASGIASALIKLDEAGLLTGGLAKANREAIIQGGGRYAMEIADALIKLNTTGLLTEGNRKTITQEGGQHASRILKGIDALQIEDLETEKRYFEQWLFRLNRSLDLGFSLGFLIHLLEVSLKGISDPHERLSIFNLLTYFPSSNLPKRAIGLNHKEISKQEKTSANKIFKHLKTRLRFHDILERNPHKECGFILFEIIQLHESVSTSVKKIPPVIRSLIKKTLPNYIEGLGLINTLIDTYFKEKSMKERCDILVYLNCIFEELPKEQIEKYIGLLLLQEDSKDSAEIIEKLCRDSMHLTKGGNQEEIFSHGESQENGMEVDVSASSSEPATVSSNPNKKRKFMGGHGTFKDAPSDKKDLQPPRRYNQTPTLSRPGRGN